jgi:NADH-quinone oxidoreductase subunit H
VSALAITLFLGGWAAPWPISVWAGANSGWWPLLWMVIKICLFVFVFFWLRGALPRIRYDQLMRLGWKVLIPGALAWTLMIATIRVWRRQGGSPGIYIVAGLIVVTLMLLAWGWDVAEVRRARRAAEIEAEDAAAEQDARAFPIPPLDLPHYHGVGLFAEGSEAAPPATVDSTGKGVTGA